MHMTYPIDGICYYKKSTPTINPESFKSIRVVLKYQAKPAASATPQDTENTHNASNKQIQR